MKTEIVQDLTQTFENHAQKTQSDVEFWLARDVQHLLGYAEWRNFGLVISKAKTACEVSKQLVTDHFVDVNKMVQLGSGVCDRTTARERQTYETFKSYQHKGLPLDEERRDLYSTMPEKWEQGQRHTPPADTHVLVGWCKDEQHLNWILDKGFYNFRMGATEGGLRLTPEVVSAKYLLLHGGDGLALPRLLRVRNAVQDPTVQGPSLMNKQQLIDTGYPTEPSREAYLVFEVEQSHAFDAMPWDLTAIPNLPDNAKQGYPFATTLDVLLDVVK